MTIYVQDDPRKIIMLHYSLCTNQRKTCLSVVLFIKSYRDSFSVSFITFILCFISVFQSSSINLQHQPPSPPYWKHSLLPYQWLHGLLSIFPFCLSTALKCTSLGWGAVSYSLSQWSQLGCSLMNHFLQNTARKSLSEFGAGWILHALSSVLLTMRRSHAKCLCIFVHANGHTCAQTHTAMTNVVCLLFNPLFYRQLLQPWWSHEWD